jgi:uncharacterized protein (DUF1501 family)
MVNRRTLLRAGAIGTTLAASGLPRLALAAPATESRLVVIVLRGGMDGLAVVPPYGDPDHERARNGIAIEPPGAVGALALDSLFGLNPRLPTFKALWIEGSLLPVHACCVPYHGRSHFDAQNVLENGSAVPYGLRTGWLNRALLELPSSAAEVAIAIAQTMPVMLVGDARVTSWYPSILPAPASETIDRISALYANDAPLANALRAARSVHDGATGADGTSFPKLMAAAGAYLARPNGPRVALLESGGWDTHANQSLPYGGLERNLSALDAGVAALREATGTVWSRTAVLLMTEFGRTVAMNGTKGTDHGTGGAAFLLGGAVAGGRVLTDWPGLTPSALLDGRDLRPTTDLRSVMKAVLIDHLGVPEGHVEDAVFPDSRTIAAADGLFKPHQA